VRRGEALELPALDSFFPQFGLRFPGAFAEHRLRKILDRVAQVLERGRVGAVRDVRGVGECAKRVEVLRRETDKDLREAVAQNATCFSRISSGVKSGRPGGGVEPSGMTLTDCIR
jgi:hypothetical protein